MRGLGGLVRDMGISSTNLIDALHTKNKGGISPFYYVFF